MTGCRAMAAHFFSPAPVSSQDFLYLNREFRYNEGK